MEAVCGKTKENGSAGFMCLDWVSRGIIFWLRFRHSKWKTYRVI